MEARALQKSYTMGDGTELRILQELDGNSRISFAALGREGAAGNVTEELATKFPEEKFAQLAAEISPPLDNATAVLPDLQTTDPRDILHVPRSVPA